MATRKHKIKTKKHHKHSRRLSGILSSKPTAGSVLAGIGLGLAGGMLGTFAMGKAEEMLQKENVALPGLVSDLASLLGAAGVGLIAFFAQRRKYPQRAAGNLLGAGGTGLVLSGMKVGARYNLPGFSGIATVTLKGIIQRDVPGARRLGVVVDTERPALPEPRMGLVVDDSSRRAGQFGVVVDDARQVFGKTFRGLQTARVP